MPFCESHSSCEIYYELISGFSSFIACSTKDSKPPAITRGSRIALTFVDWSCVIGVWQIHNIPHEMI